MSLTSIIATKKALLENMYTKKCFLSPTFITEKLGEQLASLDRRITKSAEIIFESKKRSVEASAMRLSALNPMNVLARGYSAVFDSQDKVITSTSQLKKDDEISLVMSDGKIKAKVM